MAKSVESGNNSCYNGHAAKAAREGPMKKKWMCAFLALCLLLTAVFAAAEEYQTLKKGDKGEAVLALKQRMYELGYFTSTNFSNEFNDVTVRRLQELQKKNGLTADGVATPEVQTLIFSDDCLPKSASAKKADAAADSDQPVAEIPGLADFSSVFADKFLAEGEAPVTEEMAYYSADVSIQIKTYREYRSDIYVADIYVRTLDGLRRGFEGGVWKGKNQKVARVVDMALTHNAILALTGDNAYNETKSIVYENGVRRRANKPNRQMCVIFNDGEMRTYKSSEITAKKLEEDGRGVWQTFMFGPGLLDENGHAYKTYKSVVSTANPRAAIGYYEPGHYCLIQVDGRGVKSLLDPGHTCVGMTLKELADFTESLGCRAAYNLDGGQSAMMWFNGRVISNPYKGGRGCGDIVYIPRTE